MPNFGNPPHPPPVSDPMRQVSAQPVPRSRRISPEFDNTLRHVIYDRDLGCPHCGYSLSGITGTRCPECGRNVQEFLRVADTAPARLYRARLLRRLKQGIMIMLMLAVAAGAALIAPRLL
jgi:hypothetical protein